MTRASPPAMPRLATNVLPRRHVIDGRSMVVLHDLSSEQVLQIGDREWEILASADGTRDVAGIVIAAARQGVAVPESEVRRFFADLTARGLLVEQPDPPTLSPAAMPDPELPVRPLPGYSLHCDLSGRCCRMYSTVLLTVAEAERARAVLPERRFGPIGPERAFLPVRGSVPGPAVAMTMCNGGCGYLDPSGACSIHAAAGPEAKPHGCRVYPAYFVDDGVQVRVSIKTECACVLDSAGREGGEPLVAADVRAAGQIPVLTVVSRLRERLALVEGVEVDRAHARAWTERWLAAPPAADPAAACWALADAVRRHADVGAEPAAFPDTVDVARQVGPPDAAAVRPYVMALARRAAARSRIDARWRAESDRVRSVGGWVTSATVLFSDAGMLAALLEAPPEQADREHFFVRAAVFGYLPFDEDVTLELGLRDLAIRLWLARAMAAVATGIVADEDALSSLDAWLRAYGAWRYVLDPTQKE